MSGYDFHPEARIDLLEIWEYLANDNPDAADKSVNKIEHAIDGLILFPNQGHKRSDLTGRPLRFIAVGQVSNCLCAG